MEGRIYEATGGRSQEVGRQIGRKRPPKARFQLRRPKPTQKGRFQPRRPKEARLQPKTIQNGQDAPEAAKSAEEYIAK